MKKSRFTEQQISGALKQVGRVSSKTLDLDEEASCVHYSMATPRAPSATTARDVGGNAPRGQRESEAVCDLTHVARQRLEVVGNVLAQQRQPPGAGQHLKTT